jgi:hypothetical protein
MISALGWFPVLLAALIVLMIATSQITVWLFDLVHWCQSRHRRDKTPEGPPNAL